MASYYYLIASLPMLRTNAEPPLDYAAFLAMCKTAVSDRTYRTLEQLSAESDGSGLLGEWADFYRTLRSELHYQRSVKLGRPCAVPYERDAAVTAAVTAAVNAEDPLKGEQILLALEFDRLDAMTGLHSFDDHALCGYAMKLKLLERQRVFRRDEGERAFNGLLTQLRQQVFSI